MHFQMSLTNVLEVLGGTIGVVVCFILGEGLDNFWSVLLEGKNCVVDIPPERFDTTFWYNADGNKPGKTQTTKAALIEG